MMRIFIAGFVCMLCLSLQTFAQNKEGYGNDGGGQQGNPSEVIIDETGKNSGEANNKPLVRDGAYDKISIDQKQFLSYDHIREADVFWQKRIWRVIDTRQKLNQPFTFPVQPFVYVLLDIIQKHPEAKIFTDDRFTTPLSFAELQSRLGGTDTITTYDLDTGEPIQKVVRNDFNWLSVYKFRISEDWIFEKQVSKMLPRILAIAPIREVTDANGNYRGEQAMFWAYFPAFRPYLAKYETFNPLNDSQRLTWLDLLEMRMFASNIVKESNVLDQRISDYAMGRDALLESDRIKTNLMEFEHNLWSY